MYTDFPLWFVLIPLLIALVTYVFYSYCLYRIAIKTKTLYPWLAVVPLVNLVYIFYIAKFPWWLIIVLVVTIFAPSSLRIVSLISLVGYCYAWIKVSENLNRPKWWGIIMLITPVNLILLWFLAFRDSVPAVNTAQIDTKI